MNYFKNIFQGEDIIRGRTSAYGEYRGFHMCVTYDDELGIVQAEVKYTNENAGMKEQIQGALEEEVKRRNLSYSNYVGDHVVQLSAMSVIKQQAMDCAEEMVEIMIQILKSMDCKSGCEICGKATEVRDYIVDNKVRTFCEDCAAEQKIKNKSGNRSKIGYFLRGVAGALIGALFGGMLYSSMFEMGFVAYIFSAAISWLTFKGYALLGDGMDGEGVMVSVIISILTLLGASYLGWSTFLSGENGIRQSFEFVFNNLFWIMGQLELIGKALGILAQSFLFLIVGMLWASR